MSSTFSHKDDLIDRVLTEPKNAAKFYLDSGWPGDNYEATLAMAMALQSRGYVFGRGLPPPRVSARGARGSRLGQPAAPAAPAPVG